MSGTNDIKTEEFDWIQLRKDVHLDEETVREKFFKKFRQNPFVPIGCLATVGALTFGLRSFYLGRKQMSQYMMRARIVAQGFTVFALLFGIAMAATKKY